MPPIKTILLVAGIPALICGAVALFFTLGAPTWLVWPLVVSLVAAAIAPLLYFRARNWLLYALVSTGAGCFAKGGLGLALRTSGEFNSDSEPQNLIRVAWDLAYGGSNLIDASLIVAGILLFGMALILQISREIGRPTSDRNDPHETKPTDSLATWFDDNVHSANLSESLPRALRFAKQIGDEELSRWIRLELYGYNEQGGMKESDTVPEYRAVPGRWMDKYDAMLDVSSYPDLAILNEYRFRSSIAELEELGSRTEMQNISDVYMTNLFREHMGIEVFRFCFNPIGVRGTLDVIRNLLAEKLHTIQTPDTI
ncbi:hypothetical protein [Rosistilla oblonga]|uniref:AbiTii domain-containing protein n=1 Tax=Rosistilla oblonga TaxID=2527990 RepID=UPI003A96E598